MRYPVPAPQDGRPLTQLRHYIELHAADAQAAAELYRRQSRVDSHIREFRGKPTWQQSGSANLPVYAAIAHWWSTGGPQGGDLAPLVEWARRQFLWQGPHGWGDHELLSSYQPAVLAAVMTVAERRPQPDVVKYLDAANLLLALASVHQRSESGWPATVVAPGLRTPRELAIEGPLSYLAGCLREPVRRPGHLWTRPRRGGLWSSRVARHARWASEHGELAKRVASYHQPGAPRRAVELLRDLNLRMRPTSPRARLVFRRTAAGAEGYFAPEIHLPGPNFPPFVAASWAGSPGRYHPGHPYPEGATYPRGDPGRNVVALGENRIEVRALGATRRRWFLRWLGGKQNFQIAIPRPVGETLYEVEIDARGITGRGEGWEVR